ncbi:hypothetical protein MMC10_011067 [Thelotrema lepadinum]|nr:hypothetical protein [Thelotrema lepadinum]
MPATFLGKLKRLNEERKEKKRFSREYIKTLEPELQSVVEDNKLDVKDANVRAQLKESQLNLCETKRRKELLQLLGLQPPDTDDLAIDGCGNGRHKLLPCGHYTPSMAPTECQDDCSSGEFYLFRVELPLKKRNPGRRTSEVFKEYRRNGFDSVRRDSTAAERLEKMGNDKLNCTTCVFRKYQDAFYFLMQEVSCDAELIDMREETPYYATVPGLHRVIDFKFRNPDGTFRGGSTPIQIWELFQEESWVYLNAVGTAINNPGYNDAEIPPEYEDFDPELLSHQRRSRLCTTERRTPDFLPYSVKENIRKEYFFSLLDLRNRGGVPRKKVTFDDFEPAPQIKSYGLDSPPIHCKAPAPSPQRLSTSAPSNCSTTSSVGSMGYIRPVNSIGGVNIPRNWNLSVDMDYKRFSFERSKDDCSIQDTINTEGYQAVSPSPEKLPGRGSEYLHRPLPEEQPAMERKPMPSANPKTVPHTTTTSMPNTQSFRERMHRHQSGHVGNDTHHHQSTLSFTSPPDSIKESASVYCTANEHEIYWQARSKQQRPPPGSSSGGKPQVNPASPIANPPLSSPRTPKHDVSQNHATNPEQAPPKQAPNARPVLPTIFIPYHPQTNAEFAKEQHFPVPHKDSKPSSQFLHGDPFGSPDSTPKSPKGYNEFWHGVKRDLSPQEEGTGSKGKDDGPKLRGGPKGPRQTAKLHRPALRKVASQKVDVGNVGVAVSGKQDGKRKTDRIGKMDEGGKADPGTGKTGDVWIAVAATAAAAAEAEKVDEGEDLGDLWLAAVREYGCE